MLFLHDLEYKVGTRIIYEDVELNFMPGERYAVTGPNGSGKSTLFKIIAGDVVPDKGNIRSTGRIGFLRQHIEEYMLSHRVVDVVIMGNDRLWNAISMKDELLDAEYSDEIGYKLGELEDIINEENGYNAEPAAIELLHGLGIEMDVHYKALKELKESDKLKVLLAQAVFGHPAIMLLDEPTNFVDIFGLEWLKRMLLKEYKGILLFTSHDIHFVNDIATRVVDIDYGTITEYTGNYSEMAEQKSSFRDLESKGLESQKKKAEKLQKFINKFGAGTRASQARSRQRSLEKLNIAEVRVTNIRRPYIHFDENAPDSGVLVLKAHNISKSFDGVPVVSGSWEIKRGEKIAVVGSNGIGKSTLAKMLSKHIDPDEGEVVYSPTTRIGYFPQNHDDILNSHKDTKMYDWLLDNCLRANVQVSDQDIRSVLGKMLFSGDDAFKHIGVLSGGEKVRLMFSDLMLKKPNLLILDEPTNHLDIESVVALDMGLRQYKKTLILVTHGRIGALCDRTCLLHRGKSPFATGKWYECGVDEFLSDHYNDRRI